MQLAAARTALKLGLPAQAQAPARRRSRLCVSANTLWQLAPDDQWCKAHAQACKALSPVDLTGTIGKKRVCSVASHDVVSEEVIDMCIVDHGGIHLVFEAEGAAVPLDSPSLLFVTDVGSTCTVAVDGRELQKGQRVPCKPGCRVQMGAEACYVVQRNVFAHA